MKGHKTLFIDMKKNRIKFFGKLAHTKIIALEKFLMELIYQVFKRNFLFLIYRSILFKHNQPSLGRCSYFLVTSFY